MQTLMPNSQTNVEEKEQKQEDYPTIALDLILEKWDLRIQVYILYFVKDETGSKLCWMKNITTNSSTNLNPHNSKENNEGLWSNYACMLINGLEAWCITSVHLEGPSAWEPSRDVRLMA